jgi:hypothetical protein
MTTNANQTVTGIKTFTQNIIGNLTGDIFASNGTTKVLENGTGANATFTGDVTGNITGNVTGNLTGDVFASDGTTKILENGTGANATFTGNVTGNLTGNVTGNLTGNVTGNVTGNAGTATILETTRTIAISGAVTGTATSFNGGANIVIPATITSGATITSPAFAGTATGSLISNVLQGVTDGSAAASGFVGEVISSTVAVGSAVTLTSGIVSNVTTIPIQLTAGEWYVNAQVNYRASATTSITMLLQGTSETSATIGAQDTFSRLIMAAVTPTAALDFSMPIRGRRIVVTSTTPIYLIAAANFSGVSQTLSAYGTIEARRIR